jgi:hypothetical protein
MRGLIGAAAMTLAASASAEAQVALEVRGGLNVPTFDITDAAKAGAGFGGSLYLKATDRVWLIGEADFGMHPGADLPAGGSGADVDVSHFIAKLGYQLGNGGGKWTVVLNAGAGAMRFAIDGGPSFTYPAINVGAKLSYALSRSASFVISPQGDIAFTKEAELGTTKAWVWPFTAGLRVSF